MHNGDKITIYFLGSVIICLGNNNQHYLQSAMHITIIQCNKNLCAIEMFWLETIRGRDFCV